MIRTCVASIDKPPMVPPRMVKSKPRSLSSTWPLVPSAAAILPRLADRNGDERAKRLTAMPFRLSVISHGKPWIRPRGAVARSVGFRSARAASLLMTASLLMSVVSVYSKQEKECPSVSTMEPALGTRVRGRSILGEYRLHGAGHDRQQP